MESNNKYYFKELELFLKNEQVKYHEELMNSLKYAIKQLKPNHSYKDFKNRFMEYSLLNTNESKQEDNKLIAEFMGYKTYKRNGYDMVSYSENNERTLQDTHYHTSWDWLMPVIEKIQDKYVENPELDYQYIDEIRLALPNIQEVYYLVVEFIKDQNN